MNTLDQNTNFDAWDALRHDRDGWRQRAIDQAEYIQHLEQQLSTLQKQIQSMEQQSTKHIGYNVEQMTINMSGGTLVQHADLVQTSGEVLVENKEPTYQPPKPKTNDYNAVREYIAERKKYDETFRVYWDSHNLKQNCIYLTQELGWIVDDHSLGANLNRHR